jgi:hypothetical protein
MRKAQRRKRVLSVATSGFLGRKILKIVPKMV